jgi:hypothetical protein
VLPEGKGPAPYRGVSVIPQYVIYDKEVGPSVSFSCICAHFHGIP